jgi:hypothetical protein
MSNAGWHPDPLARHQLRYFDGEQWTPHVVDESVLSFDPLTASTPVEVDDTATDSPSGSPTRARARRVRGLVIVAILVVVVGAALGAVAFASSSSSKTTTTTVHGSFIVANAYDGPPDAGADSGRCLHDSGHGDVNLSTPVVLEDDRGTVLRRTTLGPGRAVGNACVFTFTLAVEEGSPYYVVSVGNHRSTPYTFAQLGVPDAVALTEGTP